MIKSISYDQQEIIKNIIKLHCPSGIELDPTYSKGVFYKNNPEIEPLEKFDLYPKTDDTLQSNANNLPHLDCQISSIMFDPPFIVGHTKDKPTGIMGERFHGFRYIKDLWEWYEECLTEFHRILENKGILISNAFLFFLINSIVSPILFLVDPGYFYKLYQRWTLKKKYIEKNEPMEHTQKELNE